MNSFRESYIKRRDSHKRSKTRTKHIQERWRIEDLIRDTKSRGKVNYLKVPRW